MLAGSTLIIGENKEKIETYIQDALKSCGIKSLTSPDIRVEKNEGKSIGIDQIREAQKFLVKKPLSSPKKLLIVQDAEKLTIEAQNAFLKTLEEPQSTSQIILICKTEESLLPTITSRCQKVYVQTPHTPKQPLLQLAESFYKGGVGERLALIDENKDIFTNKESALEFLDALLYVLRPQISKENLAFINLAGKVQRDLSTTNLNPRLALETLALCPDLR